MAPPCSSRMDPCAAPSLVTILVLCTALPCSFPLKLLAAPSVFSIPVPVTGPPLAFILVLCTTTLRVLFLLICVRPCRSFQFSFYAPPRRVLSLLIRDRPRRSSLFLLCARPLPLFTRVRYHRLSLLSVYKYSRRVLPVYKRMRPRLSSPFSIGVRHRYASTPSLCVWPHREPLVLSRLRPCRVSPLSFRILSRRAPPPSFGACTAPSHTSLPAPFAHPLRTTFTSLEYASSVTPNSVHFLAAHMPFRSIQDPAAHIAASLVCSRPAAHILFHGVSATSYHALCARLRRPHPSSFCLQVGYCAILPGRAAALPLRPMKHPVAIFPARFVCRPVAAPPLYPFVAPVLAPLSHRSSSCYLPARPVSGLVPTLPIGAVTTPFPAVSIPHPSPTSMYTARPCISRLYPCAAPLPHHYLYPHVRCPLFRHPFYHPLYYN